MEVKIYEIINGQIKHGGKYFQPGEVVDDLSETEAEELLARKVIRPAWTRNAEEGGDLALLRGKKRVIGPDESLQSMSIGAICTIEKQNLVKNIAKEWPHHQVSAIRDKHFDDLVQLVLDERRKATEGGE